MFKSTVEEKQAVDQTTNAAQFLGNKNLLSYYYINCRFAITNRIFRLRLKNLLL